MVTGMADKSWTWFPFLLRQNVFLKTYLKTTDFESTMCTYNHFSCLYSVILLTFALLWPPARMPCFIQLWSNCWIYFTLSGPSGGRMSKKSGDKSRKGCLSRLICVCVIVVLAHSSTSTAPSSPYTLLTQPVLCRTAEHDSSVDNYMQVCYYCMHALWTLISTSVVPQYLLHELISFTTQHSIAYWTGARFNIIVSSARRQCYTFAFLVISTCDMQYVISLCLLDPPNHNMPV